MKAGMDLSPGGWKHSPGFAIHGPMPLRVRNTYDRVRIYVREWRKHRNTTLEQLAEQMGMSASTLARIESGKVQYTSQQLSLIAQALVVSPGDLMRRPTDGD